MKYLLFLILPLFAFSQEKSVLINYKAIYNTELPTTKNGYLYVNENQKKTVYFTENVDETEEESEDSEVDVTINLDSGQKRFNYFDYEKDTLITQDDIFRDSKLIKEKIPVLNWKLLKDTKSIDGKITLNKAVCYFRGRNYVAWYSADTPIKAGPWKFQGLSGLIYEIHDETKRYNWFLQKVTTTTFNFSNVDIDSKETISIKEYAKLKFNDTGLDKKLLSKLPRGATVVSQKSFRTGFEIKFEWEEEQKQD